MEQINIYTCKLRIIELLPGSMAAEEDENDAEENDWQVDLFPLSSSWTESLKKNRINSLILIMQVLTGFGDYSIKIKIVEKNF